MKNVLVILLFLAAAHAAAQEEIRGHILGRDADGATTPVAGATVYWLGTTRGTIADSAGMFVLPLVKESNRLVVRHAAYFPDTLVIGAERHLAVMLRQNTTEVDEVRVTGERPGLAIDYLSPESTQRISKRELGKAACCNLSESFETNPAVDVSFTDAITGARQIEMLGLSGVYTQTTLENLPYIRGLASTVGLSFIPGTWIEAINVSKGIGSVANGYESLTGQIDVGLRKPEEAEERRFFLNLYGNQESRLEGNLFLRQPLGETWSSMTMLHASALRSPVDMNEDRFLDTPLFSTVNALQRFHFKADNGWEGQFSVQAVGEEKEGGTRNAIAALSGAPPFRYGTTTRFFRVQGKTGHMFPDDPLRSFGIQWSLATFTNASYFGSRPYDGKEQTGYVNFIYQSPLGSPVHKFRAGVSFLFDRFDEHFDGLPFARTERVPGIFAEYTYQPITELTMVAGVRTDWHNFYGSMLTPRLHVRYAPEPDWVIRLVAGKGYRTANIFAENASVFASSRMVHIHATSSFGYGLPQESAWNYGMNLTHYFRLGGREATVAVDFYRTQFENQITADLDASPQEVMFLAVDNSYSNSFQAEVSAQPVQGLETRIAYRYLDVQQRLEGTWLQRPLSAQHRALFTVGYTARGDGDGTPGTSVDFTIQWFGPKRIPATASNPEGLRARATSPPFATLNAQVTRPLIAGLELYVGGENLLDFRQNDPILDPLHPTGPYFDASLIWGPITGRMLYAGVRYGL